jgi:hypothetical protein
MTNLLTHEQFVPHANSKFRVQTDSDPIELELTTVSELSLTAHQERFSLTFRGPKDKFLEQATRLVQHDVLGEFELFLVPLAINEEGYLYEASFNRFRET